MGLKLGVCGDDKRKAGVVRNDLGMPRLALGPPEKSPGASNSPSSVTLYLQTPLANIHMDHSPVHEYPFTSLYLCIYSKQHLTHTLQGNVTIC